MYNFFTLLALILLPFISLILAVCGKFNIISLLLILFLFLISFLIFRKFKLNIFYKFRSEFEKKEEEINLLTDSINVKKLVLETLPAKCKKIFFLFSASQELMELDDREEIFDFLINTCLSLFTQADNILLFLLQKEKDSLSLTRSLKKENFIIKEKQGDTLDKWVLKTNQSLMIEDLTKDFKFDCSKIAAFSLRAAHSFILSPLSIGEKIIGTMRIESRNPYSFTMDDSRLLRGICDIGAVVLERANLFGRIEELAIKDSLTSLFLRDYFLNRLEKEIQRAHLKKKNLGVIMLDIDDFKKINDTYGHIVGDLVLKKLARILTIAVSDTGNVISRFGGEEFIFFIVECAKDRLLRLGEDIRKEIEKSTVTFRRKNINFTVSLGAAIYPKDGEDAYILINHADKLLYKAKREGKNRLCFTG